MAATERNEVVLRKGNSLQYTKLLKDKINAVCHIEIVSEDSKSRKRRQGRGTGFLSKLYTPSERGFREIYGVVTSNHVLPSETHAKNAIVTFGYEGSGEGEKVKLKPKMMFRTEKKLDYTFVGVNKEDINGLKLTIQPILMEPEPELKKRENVMIIQHPKGGPKKFSLEKISKVEKPYVFYKADTEDGSSGSPVLTSEGLALIAVHHIGNKTQRYNQGILISEILKHLQEGSSSASNEVKQKEKRGSAAKKPKLDPLREPGTLGVSSTRKTRKFKASASNEVKQKEKRGSAAKKPKLDPFGEPGTLGVSSTRKTRKFKVKDGEPDDKELSHFAQESTLLRGKLSRLAKESTLLRGKLGRELGVPQRYQDEISVNHKGDAYKMTFRVLLCWRRNSSATSRYQELFDALTKIGCRDLAEKYCCC